MSDSRMRYRFGPLERRGILGPVRAGQAAVLATGGLLAIALLDRAPTATGAFIATALFAGAVLLAVAPVGSRTAEEWAPVAASFAIRRVRGRARFRSQLPMQGVRPNRPRSSEPLELQQHTPAPPDSLELQEHTPAPPDSLAGVRILAAAYRDRPVGVLCEQRGRLLTVVLACRVVSFSLLDPDAQERRLARWGLVLSGAASTAIRRIQWVERTAPARGDELARWLHAERDPAVPLRGAPMIESYLQLIGASASVAQEHEILIAVQVDARRVRDRGADAASRAVIADAERVAQGLEAAEVVVRGALSPGQLARALRTAFDPYAGAELAALQVADPGRDGLDEANAWPLGACEGWDHYRSDGAVHATYWIGGWPRIDVSPMFMEALLGRSSAVRTVAVTFDPIPPQRSTREVEAAITRDRADSDLRRRFGQAETARQRQAQDATLRREAELAAGHSEVRVAGFVTVSGRDRDDLRRASCRGARAGGAGPAGAAPHVRPAGRCVHVHAAAMQGAEVTTVGRDHNRQPLGGCS